MKFLNFFQFSRVIFALLDRDPDKTKKKFSIKKRHKCLFEPLLMDIQAPGDIFRLTENSLKIMKVPLFFYFSGSKTVDFVPFL
jgi:hypothetical protein